MKQKAMDNKVLWSIYDKDNPPREPIYSIIFQALWVLDWLIPWKFLGFDKPLFGGDIYELGEKGILRFILDKIRSNPDAKIIHFRICHIRMMLVIDSELSHKIFSQRLEVVRRGKTYDRLVLFFGKGTFTNKIESRWKHQRTIFLKLVSTKKLKMYAEELYTTFMESIDHRIQQNNKVELVSTLSSAGLVAFCKVYLGVDVSDDPDRLIGPMNRLLKYVNGAFEPVDIPFEPRYEAFMRDRNIVHDYMRELISSSIKNGNCDPVILEEFSNEEITEEELVELMISIVLGGHETTARLILGIVCALANHPEHVDKLRKEMGYYDLQEPLNHDILKLPFLKNIVKEGTRLFSPVWIVSREPMIDLEFDEIHIDKGTQILLSPMIINRSKIWGDDREVFNPDRFETIESDLKRLFFPFVLGPENCSGKTFAILETSLIVAGLFLKYDIRILDNKITPQSVGTFRLTDRLEVEFEKRW